MFNRKLLFSIFNIAARTYSSKVMTLNSRPVLLKCHIVSGSSVLHLPVAKMSGGDTNHISFEEVKSLKDNTSVLLIDVREPAELKETGIIPGSINVPLSEVESTLKNLSAKEFLSRYNRSKPAENTPLVFSCRSGRRSEMAQNIALALGYSNVRNFQGGWLEWEEKTKKI